LSLKTETTRFKLRECKRRNSD